MGSNARLKIALAQLNLLVGDVRGNLRRVVQEAARAEKDFGADLVLFPELTLSGYPPEDLLFHRGLRHQVEAALTELNASIKNIGVVVGYPEYEGDAIYNAARLVEVASCRHATARSACPTTRCSTRSATSVRVGPPRS